MHGIEFIPFRKKYDKKGVLVDLPAAEIEANVAAAVAAGVSSSEKNVAEALSWADQFSI